MLSKTDIGELEFQLEYFTGMRCTTIGKTNYQLDIAIIMKYPDDNTSVNYIVKISTITQCLHIKHIIDINGMYNPIIYDNIQKGIDTFNKLYESMKG